MTYYPPQYDPNQNIPQYGTNQPAPQYGIPQYDANVPQYNTNSNYQTYSNEIKGNSSSNVPPSNNQIYINPHAPIVANGPMVGGYQSNLLNPRTETCYFHSDVEAKNKCENCGKLLCLRCTHVFRIITRRTSTSATCCNDCYEIIKKRRIVRGIVVLILSLLFSIFFICLFLGVFSSIRFVILH